MKKLTIYSLLLLTMGFGSCKKFLDEYSQDAIRPGTVADLSALMYSDAYPYQTLIDNFEMLTDDIQSNGVARGTTGEQIPAYATALINGSAMFKFDPNMFEVGSVFPNSANAYSIYYAKIKGCNVVIDALETVSGSQAEKDAIKGQCLFLRAYYYLKLVTTYAQPYSGAGIVPESAMGVPLVLSSQVRDGGLARSSLKQTYDQIEIDLLASIELMKVNYFPSSSFRVGTTAAYALLSRFYLYRALNTDWDKVISYAGLALQQNSNLTSLVTFISTTGVPINAGLFNSGNPEIIWLYGLNPNSDNATYYPSLTINTVPPYTASNELITSYEQGPTTTNYGDLRYKTYFSNYNSVIPYRTGKALSNASYGTKGLRVGEIYLNRAEALIKRFLITGNAADKTQALADLNTLRVTRYDTRTTAYKTVAIDDAAALFKFCQDERRRELCLEDGHRWVDIKRWGLPVTHVFTSTDGSTATYTLASGSNLYALPIPATAIATNSDLRQNPR